MKVPNEEECLTIVLSQQVQNSNASFSIQAWTLFWSGWFEELLQSQESLMISSATSWKHDGGLCCGYCRRRDEPRFLRAGPADKSVDLVEILVGLRLDLLGLIFFLGLDPGPIEKSMALDIQAEREFIEGLRRQTSWCHLEWIDVAGLMQSPKQVWLSVFGHKRLDQLLLIVNKTKLRNSDCTFAYSATPWSAHRYHCMVTWL